MAEQPAIDPRYDPAFQRGYNGPVATGSRADAVVRRPAPHVTSALQRPAAEPGSPHPHPDPVAEIVRDPEPTDQEAARAATAATIVTAPAAMRPPWSNPFAIAVTVVGIVVLALGVWLLQETYQLTQSETGFQTQADYWFLQWGMIGGPVFAALGIAILVAVLVLCAVYWGRRPRHDGAD